MFLEVVFIHGNLILILWNKFNILNDTVPFEQLLNPTCITFWNWVLNLILMVCALLINIYFLIKHGFNKICIDTSLKLVENAKFLSYFFLIVIIMMILTETHFCIYSGIYFFYVYNVFFPNFLDDLVIYVKFVAGSTKSKFNHRNAIFFAFRYLKSDLFKTQLQICLK